MDPLATAAPASRALILAIVRDALQSLRTLLRTPEETGISWARPFVELRYPLTFGGSLEVGPLPSQQDPSQRPLPVLSTQAPAALPHEGLQVLASLTHRVVVFREQDREHPQLPLEVDRELDRLPAPERDRERRRHLKPFTFGMIDPSDLPEGFSGETPCPPLHLVPLSPEVAQRLAAEVESFAPGLEFSGTRSSGQPFAGTVVGSIHPRLIDVSRRHSYYPIVAGLVLRPSEEGSSDLSTWSREDHEVLWVSLSTALHAAEVAVATIHPQPVPRLLPPVEPSQANPQTGVNAAIPPLPPPLEAGPPSLPFEVAFGPVQVDTTALTYTANLHNLRFPKRLADLPSFDDLKEQEIQRVLARHGEGAYHDHPKEGSKAESHSALLKRRPIVGGGFAPQLTAEAERHLKVREGLQSQGYRFVSKTWKREFLTRVFEVGTGYVEVGLSWFGLAGLWTEEGRESLQRQARDFAERLTQPLLFEDLNEKQKRLVESTLRQAQIFLDGQKLMRALLVQVPKQNTTRVELSAFAVRKLLGIEGDPDWRERVLGAVYALTECKFMVDSFSTPRKFQAYGQFLAGNDYLGAGPGKHADGVFRFYVDPRFLGCLNAYARDTPRIESDKEILEFDFRRKLEPDELHSMSYTITDAGLPWYHAEESFTPTQENLVGWLYQQRTFAGDAVSRTLGAAAERRASLADLDDATARGPRPYGPDFCPVLPAGQPYHAALGRFLPHQNPEAGWTLRGLVSRLGYPPLPKGKAYTPRKKALLQILADFHTVIEQYLEGLVAARLDGEWTTLAAIVELVRTGRLPVARLLGDVTWFPFIPHDAEQIQIRKWEKRLADQAIAGDVPFAYTYTRDPLAAARSRTTRLEGTRPLPDGTPPVSLSKRLAEARQSRGISQEEFGGRFGVTKMSVSRWETGKKPIRRSLVPLVERWLADPSAWPSVSELEATRLGIASSAPEPRPNAAG